MEGKRITAAVVSALELGLGGCLDPLTPAQIEGEEGRDALYDQFSQACGAYGKDESKLRKLRMDRADDKTQDEAAARAIESNAVVEQLKATRKRLEDKYQLRRTQSWYCGESINDKGTWVARKETDWIRRSR